MRTFHHCTQDDVRMRCARAHDMRACAPAGGAVYSMVKDEEAVCPPAHLLVCVMGYCSHRMYLAAPLGTVTG